MLRQDKLVIVLCFFAVILIVTYIMRSRRKESLSFIVEKKKMQIRAKLYSDIPSLSKYEKPIADVIHTDFVHFDKVETNTNKILKCITPLYNKIFIITGFNTPSSSDAFNDFRQFNNVYYKDESSLYIFKMICKVTNIDITTFNLVQMDLKAAIDNKVSLYACLMCTKSPDVEILNDAEYIIYEYPIADAIKLMIPYSRIIGQDMRILTPKNDAMLKIYKLIAIDMCVYSIGNVDIASILDICQQLGGLEDKRIDNFYNLVWEPFTVSSQENSEESIDISTLERVSGKLDMVVRDDFKRFILNDIFIDGVRLTVGDRVSLRGQTYTLENDTYYVLSTNPATQTSRLATAFIFENGDEWKTIENNAKYTIIKTDEDIGLKNNSRVFFMDVNLVGHVISKNIVRLTHNLEVYDSLYKCFTNNNLLTKESCESKYDMIGKLKTSVDVWDRQCKYDTECPFFDLYNGGECTDNGYCVMPVGVQRIGYRYASKKECPYKDELQKCKFSVLPDLLK